MGTPGKVPFLYQVLGSQSVRLVGAAAEPCNASVLEEPRSEGQPPLPVACPSSGEGGLHVLSEPDSCRVDGVLLYVRAKLCQGQVGCR